MSGTQPLENRRPCQNPKGKDESDLCAQWRAAEAAENSVFWAKWGFWIAVIGSGFLLWQINLTRRAVEETGEATEAMRAANEIAERNTRMELRAYFAPDNLTSTIRTDNGVQHLDLQVVWKNTGSTPARQMRFYAFEAIENEIPVFDAPLSAESVRNFVFPGASVSTPLITISLDAADAVWRESINLFIFGRAEYEDVFGPDLRITKHCWRITIHRNNDLPLEGANISACLWRVVGTFNDAT